MNIRLKKIMAVGLALFASVLALAAANWRSTSDEAVRARFFAHRADFERLVAMANEDSHLDRIAPDFTWLDDDASWPRKDAGISEQRWNDYRQLFQKIGTSEGIMKGTDPDRIIFSIESGGLVPSGFDKGLVYSQMPLGPVLKSLDKRFPDELWDGPDRSHVLAYKPIDEHWYIYYEQW